MIDGCPHCGEVWTFAAVMLVMMAQKRWRPTFQKAWPLAKTGEI